MDIFYFVSAANWWEPGTDGQLDVGDLAAILAFTIAVVGAVTGLSRWWMRSLRSIIREEIEEFTAPIQPHANGGLSLPDVSRKVDTLEQAIIGLKASSDDTREMLVKFIIKDGLDEK